MVSNDMLNNGQPKKQIENQSLLLTSIMNLIDHEHCIETYVLKERCNDINSKVLLVYYSNMNIKSKYELAL